MKVAFVLSDWVGFGRWFYSIQLLVSKNNLEEVTTCLGQQIYMNKIIELFLRTIP